MIPIIIEKRNARYSAGYKLQSIDDFLRFGNRRFLIFTNPEKGDYITLPHWWGARLTVADAAKYIEHGIYVAIDRGA